MELCTHEKAVFFLPVNILMVWSLAFLIYIYTSLLNLQASKLYSEVLYIIPVQNTEGKTGYEYGMKSN